MLRPASMWEKDWLIESETSVEDLVSEHEMLSIRLVVMDAFQARLESG